MPQWLEKWTALILAFIEEEQSQLPDLAPSPSASSTLLCAPLHPSRGYPGGPKVRSPHLFLQIIITPIS